MTDEKIRFDDLARNMVKMFGTRESIKKVDDDNLGFMLEIALENEYYEICVIVREEMRERNG